jgi:Lon protease-like protein
MQASQQITLMTISKTEPQTHKVALFPIPNLVAFPGTFVPLHIFEPRYRRMVDDCVANNVMIGVGHTQKEIRPAPSNQVREEALNTNQATYQPHQIFSAGQCQIIETLEDGRVHVVIEINKRLLLGEEVQTLPYRIVKATEVVDSDRDSVNDTENEIFQLQAAINNALIEITTSDHPSMAEAFAQHEWLNQLPDEFSFRVFQFLRFDPDLMQEVLETANIRDRLRTIADLVGVAS